MLNCSDRQEAPKVAVTASSIAPIKPERIAKLAEELDANGDGHVSLDEFIRWCTARYAKVAHDPTLQVYKTQRESRAVSASREVDAESLLPGLM